MVYVDAFKTVGCVDCFILSTLRGHPVPEVPCPRVNDTEEFQQHVGGIDTAGYVIGTLCLGIPFLLSESVDPSGIDLTDAER